MNQVANTPQFKMEPIDDARRPNSIQGIVAMDAYLCKYIDGEGNAQIRQVFKVPGSEEVYVLSERIGGQNLLKNSTTWFREAFNELLTEKGTQVDDIGEEGAKSI